MNIFLIIIIILIKINKILSACPNNCNGHGACETAHGSRTCLCFPGYHGADCSSRVCPSGIAWVDFPTANDVAHTDFVECSNMGICNRQTGDCMCRNGYSGPACEQSI